MSIESEASREIVALAEGLLSDSEPFLAAVRALSALRHVVSEDGLDPDFMIFVAIDSETDHLPSEQTRQYCEATWLAKCDQEAVEVASFYRESVRVACETLLRRFA